MEKIRKRKDRKEGREVRRKGKSNEERNGTKWKRKKGMGKRLKEEEKEGRKLT